MSSLLYDELVPWYRLVDPVADHEGEARMYHSALAGAIGGKAETLLELGSGGGHNAYHLREHYNCTLTDLSVPMLALSRDLNPDCEHVAGDMRSLRLNRTFDAVLLHDAVVYMTTEADLRAAFETAFLHTRPGGAALVAPDCFRETFHEGAQLIEGSDRRRHLKCIEWSWDPDPNDSTYTVDYALLLRENNAPAVSFHDVHTAGLFPRATWTGLLSSVGYEVEIIPGVEDDTQTLEVLLCRRPA